MSVKTLKIHPSSEIVWEWNEIVDGCRRYSEFLYKHHRDSFGGVRTLMWDVIRAYQFYLKHQSLIRTFKREYQVMADHQIVHSFLHASPLFHDHEELAIELEAVARSGQTGFTLTEELGRLTHQFGQGPLTEE